MNQMFTACSSWQAGKLGVIGKNCPSLAPIFSQMPKIMFSDQKSQFINMTHRVPQGLILGPLLFKLSRSNNQYQ